MKHHLAKDLLDKYNRGLCSDEEKNLVETAFNRLLKSNTETYTVKEIEEADIRMRETIMTHVHTEKSIKKLLPSWIKIVAAASIVLTVGISLFLYKSNNPTSIKKQIVNEVLANDVGPGKNRATLTLSDGRKVLLAAASNGQLAEQAGVKIRKTSDGQLIYENGTNNTKSVQPVSNTLSTANGETYTLVLPDGSKVWLNAATSLKYPASFVNLRKRVIELSGEAYFEVSKDKSRPFIVKSVDQEVEVLGTHFNINSYTDELYTRTTLLEGAVRVSTGNNQIALQPGKQASLNKKQGNLVVSEVDVEEVMAWKNGNFVFMNEDIKSVMKKISRWYDVEVIYEQDVSEKAVWGTISRFRNVSQVLNMLEMTGVVKFKIEGRRIIVKEK